MKMVHVLIGALVAAGVIGVVRSFAVSSPPSSAPVREAPVEPRRAAAGEAIEGEVLEAIDVPKYTYLRVGAKGTDGKWIAVPTATLKVGDHARLAGGMKMTEFKSTALGRTFPEIYFGTLDTGNDAHAGGMRSPDMIEAHAKAGQSSVEVKPVSKATGPNAKTVAETIAERVELNGKTVRIHATVVKATPGVLGKTFLHLRDGSGDASGGNNDLTVTTEAIPAVGDTILIEGTVVLDRDIGAGYKFPTLIEDAKILPAR